MVKEVFRWLWNCKLYISEHKRLSKVQLLYWKKWWMQSYAMQVITNTLRWCLWSKHITGDSFNYMNFYLHFSLFLSFGFVDCLDCNFWLLTTRFCYSWRPLKRRFIYKRYYFSFNWLKINVSNVHQTINYRISIT